VEEQGDCGEIETISSGATAQITRCGNRTRGKAEIGGDAGEQDGAGLHGEEVVSVDVEEVEGSRGLALPLLCFSLGGHGVAASAKAGDGAGEGRTLHILIGFDDGHIGAETGDEQGAEFRVGKDFLGDAAVALADLAEKAGVGQSMEVGVAPGDTGPGRSGGEEPNGQGKAATTELAGSFEGDFGAETVTEEGAGAVEQRGKGVSDGGCEGSHRAKRIFAEAVLAAGRLDESDFDGGMGIFRPAAKGTDAATSPGKAHQSKSCAGAAARADDGRLHCGRDRKHRLEATWFLSTITWRSADEKG
jgi:hypothetical protein